MCLLTIATCTAFPVPSAFFDVQETEAAIRLRASRRTATDRH
jgi:hypothetical protein